MVSTGSEPFVPPFAGLETVANKYYFMTLDDALSLEKALAPDKKVLILGAGLIGLKCCEGISRRVHSVTVVDLSPRILSSILNETSAQIVRKQIEAHNVTFRLGQTVREFRGNSAVLDSGEELTFDLLVLAVGVRPRTALIREAGGAVGRGIITDQYQETSLKELAARSIRELWLTTTAVPVCRIFTQRGTVRKATIFPRSRAEFWRCSRMHTGRARLRGSIWRAAALRSARRSR